MTGAKRGRLFRKYVVVLLVLVGGVLMSSSLVELYFSYRETQRAIVRVERATAVAAASRIEQFLKDVEHQVLETTRIASDDPDASQVRPGSLGFREGLGAAMAEQRELDFLRLLRNVPAISELSHLDLAGREQLRVSRLEPDVIGSQEDASGAPRFVQARAGKTYWSPVYLRNESEPYVTLAVPVGKYAVEVTTAEISLNSVLRVISELEVGPGGYAYVVDAQNQLVAHPDHQMLRSRRDLSSLAQVALARAAAVGPATEAQAAVVADGLAGGQVLAAHAPIGSLGWLVFVERPAADAYAPLRAPILRSAVIFVLGLGLSILASLVLARRMVAPIRILQDGAMRIGAGDLGHRIELRTGDELEALGEEFNQTAAKLEESYASLEQKVEARTRELAQANAGLTESLEQQTATSEVLKVISRSTFDLQPVLETLIEHAVRLGGADGGAIYRFDGVVQRLAAAYNIAPDFREFVERHPLGRDRGTAVGRALDEGRTVHIDDVLADPEYTYAGRRLGGYRTILGVPMLKDAAPVGVFAVWRHEVQPFTERQVELVTTFADQGAIAIENVRLFQALEARTRELTRSVSELQALGDVSQAVSSTLDLQTVLATIVSRAVELSGSHEGIVYEFDEAGQTFHARATHQITPEHLDAVSRTPVRLGEGAVGRAGVVRAPVQVADIREEWRLVAPQVRELHVREGMGSLLAVPLIQERRLLGGLVVLRRERGTFSGEVIAVLQTFAAQSVIAIQNARLYREIEDKSRQLETASRHKSEFLANMSHELRTPLNAIIGFSEVLVERMFGELNDKQDEYLRDIYASGRHLLSLINDILDLSKVEAGRMELDLGSFDLPEALASALTLVRSRADAHGICIESAIDDRLGDLMADERKVKQIVLNLLSNAVKFTPDGGRVCLAAGLDDGVVQISVSDTGIGIAPEDQAAVFEEFRQVGSDQARKHEGTGLGLALARRFVELHGGTIWLTSAPGEGSTFTFTLPLRPRA